MGAGDPEAIMAHSVWEGQGRCRACSDGDKRIKQSGLLQVGQKIQGTSELLQVGAGLSSVGLLQEGQRRVHNMGLPSQDMSPNLAGNYLRLTVN